jgi:ribosomal RNA-processing protein 12
VPVLVSGPVCIIARLSVSKSFCDVRSLQATICGGITVLARGQSENLAANGTAESDRKAMEGAAVNLLPVMFKMVSESKEAGSNTSNDMDTTEKPAASGSASQDGQKTRSITDAIASLVPLAPKPFLHNLFQKLMHRLLEEAQSDSGDRGRVCSLLSLSECLVASEVFEESSISFLYRALKPLIRNDEFGARVQKRAYKVLAEICQRYHSFVADIDRLKELSSLLTGTMMTSQVAARYMRLKCLNLIIEGLGDHQKEHLVSEVSRFNSKRSSIFNKLTVLLTAERNVEYSR